MLHLLTFTLLILPGTLLAAGGGSNAADFVPLVGIPYVDSSENVGIQTYVDALYKAAISIAAFLAVLKIIYAGVLYMLSEVVTDKGKAKKEIYGAIIGLLIVIGAFLLLNTINPQLTTLNALQDITEIQVTPDQVEGPEDVVGSVVNITEEGTQSAVEELKHCTPSNGYRIDLKIENGETIATCVEDVPFPEDSTDNTNTTSPETDSIQYTNSTGETFEIDTESTYTIQEAAIPEANIPAGEFHNQSGRIIQVIAPPPPPTTDPDMSGDGVLYIEVGIPLQFKIQLENGETTTIPCGLITPLPPGC